VLIGSTYFLIDSTRANGLVQTAKDLAVNEALTWSVMRFGKFGLHSLHRGIAAQTGAR
jgi:hypothetical protein